MYYNYYFIIIVPVMIFAAFAQYKVNANYKKYSIPNSRRMTGAMAAEKLLRLNGISDVKIESIKGSLTDHYDPKSNVIRLSEGVYNSSTIAAVGIACHEAGHACQHAQNYFPIKVRNAIIPITQIGSGLGIPLALIGFVFSWGVLIDIGLLLYATIAFFQLVTLPVEFNASSRALKTIKENNFLDDNDYIGAKRVLTAAALTYVAALVSSLAQLLRLMLMFGRRRD